VPVVIRRSFRIGLTLGLLAGLAFALAKMLGSRPAPEAAAPPTPTQPWPRLTTDPAEPARPSRALQPDPDAPAPRFPIAAPARPSTADNAPAPAPEAPPPVAAPSTPTAAAPPTRKAKAAKAPGKQPTASKAPAKRPAAAARQPAAKATAAKKSAKKKPLVAPWVEPSGDVCPTSHPVKGKLASKIFHLPGMLNYDRTKPDRCYRDVTAAETDGLRPAKR
jgi:hypothetical protein